MRLGFVRRPGRETFKNAHDGFFPWARRYENWPERFLRYCTNVLYSVCPCVGRCVCKLRRGIDRDRATAAPPVKVTKVQWDWPPDAQVEVLLWLAAKDPLPETLSKVTGTYADLLATLGKKHGAPESLNDKAVYDALRRLFIAHGKEPTYTPNRHEVLRVLAAVIGKVLDEVDEAAVAVSATPVVESSSAASGPSGRTGNLFRGKIRTAAAEVKSVASR